MAKFLHGEKLRALLSGDETTYATTYLAILTDRYGTEFFDWDEESIAMQVQSDFKVNLSRLARDKIQAMLTALTTDLFYKSLEVFVNIANVLSGAEASFGVWDPADEDEVAWAVTEVTLNDPDHRDEFSTEIKTYMGAVLQMAGVTQAPRVLPMAIDVSRGDVEQFQDDPELYNAIWKKDNAEAQAITDTVEHKLTALLSQLTDAPLTNRSPENWEKFLRSIPGSVSQPALRMLRQG